MDDDSREQDLSDSYRDYHRNTEREPYAIRRRLTREDQLERMLLAAGSAFVADEHADYDTREEREMDLGFRRDR